MTIRIFLADDHEVVRDGLRFILGTQADMKVVGEAADGRQTVDQVILLKPDVVVMDIGMPELNGIEATRGIHRSRPSTHVVILSMHSSREHILRAFQAGAQGYILKECVDEEVVIAIRAVHAGRRYLCHTITDILIDHFVIRDSTGVIGSPLDSLTSREREILQLVVEGKSTASIAAMLYLSTKTVETYRSRLMEKLGVSNLPDLVKFAIQHGLTSPSVS
jgi:DNA-binding NarL/FixJ family response regulator